MSTPIRKRTTWAADRNASAPPATPGYGTEDQDHPAHQPDPAQAAYAKGDPDAWAETPKAPPYPQGNPPATPGYDVEDKDHPAHEDPARNPKNARSLKAAVMGKAAKAVAVARSMMGKTADEDQIEEQALDLMDMPDEALQATFDRLSGDFLAEEEVPPEVAADPLDEVKSCGDMAPQGQDPLDALLAQGEVPEEGKKSELDDVMAQMEDLLAKVKGMKSADQNDPKGPTLAPKPKTEEEAKKTASRKRIASMLRAADTDGDGFIMKADWQGNPRIFMALDTDKDDILALDEALQACGEEPMAQDELLSPEDEMLLAEMEQKACKAAKGKKSEDDEEEVEEPKEAKKGKKAEDDEADEDEAEEPKEAKKGKKAKKSEDDEEVDAEDEAEEPKEAKKGKKAKKSEDEEPDGDEPEEGEDEPDVKEGKGKKAIADMTFATSGDPMGLGDTPVLTENDSLLRSIFGADDEEPEEDKDEEPKEAKKAKKAEDNEDGEGDEEAKESEDDEDEAEEPKEAKKGKKAKKSEDDEAEEPEAKESEDDEDEEPKEAKKGKKAKKSDDDEDADDIEFEAADEAEEPKEAKKASKTASQRPQPRKASKGVQRLGAVAKTASGANEIDNLSSLWASDPDVSEVFGVPSSRNS